MIRNYQQLNRALAAQSEAQTLSPEVLVETLEQAQAAGISLTPEQVDELFDTYAQALNLDASSFVTVAAGLLEPLSAVDALAPGQMMGTSTAPAHRPARKLAEAALRIHAGGDDRLQVPEIEGAVQSVEAALLRAGLSPTDATHSARQAVMVELGLAPGGRTIHQVDASTGSIVGLARHFGDPLAAHLTNQRDAIVNSLFEHCRLGLIRVCQAEQFPQELINDLSEVRSFDGLATLTAAYPDQRDTLARWLEVAGPEPLRAFFTGASGSAPQGSTSFETRLHRVAGQVSVAIVDANGTGELDAGDLLAIEVAKTSLGLVALTESRADRLRLAQATQTAAERMVNADGSSLFSFEVGAAMTFNDDYFEMVPNHEGIAMKLRPGISASEAMQDILTMPESYGFDCAGGNAMLWHVAQYHYFLEKYGDQGPTMFDQAFKGMRIGAAPVQDRGQSFSVDSTQALTGMMAGDWRYFKTGGVAGAPRPWSVYNGWSGENVVSLGRATQDFPERGIKTGDPIYFGHPFGIVNEAQIITSLNGHRMPIELADRADLDMLVSFDPELSRLGAEIEQRRARLIQVDDAGSEEAAGLREEIETRRAMMRQEDAFLTNLTRRLDSSANLRHSVYGLIDRIDQLTLEEIELREPAEALMDKARSLGATQPDRSNRIADKGLELRRQADVKADEITELEAQLSVLDIELYAYEDHTRGLIEAEVAIIDTAMTDAQGTTDVDRVIGLRTRRSALTALLPTSDPVPGATIYRPFPGDL